MVVLHWLLLSHDHLEDLHWLVSPSCHNQAHPQMDNLRCDGRVSLYRSCLLLRHCLSMYTDKVGTNKLSGKWAWANLEFSFFWNKDQKGYCVPIDVIIALTFLYSACAIISDFSFAILPIFIVWGLNMPAKTRIMLIPVLGMACV